MGGSLKSHSSFLIAVVDDDQSVCEALAGLLKSLGFRAVTFQSARDFLRSPELSNVSCAILDVCMPNMTGVELQRHLIANHPIPMVFITAYANSQIERQVMQAGAICLLTKPFSDETLSNCLNSALGI